MTNRPAPPCPGIIGRQGKRPPFCFYPGENLDYYSDFHLHHLNIEAGGRRGHRPYRVMVSGGSGPVEYEYDSQVEELDDAQPARPVRPNPRHRPAGDRKTISFGKALPRLYQQLEKSEQFYRSFKDEYDSDVDRIKKYVTDDQLLRIWISRVKGEKDPKVDGNQDGDDEQLLETAEKFPSMDKKLRDAFNEAMGSTMTGPRGLDRKGEIRLASAKRLKEKVCLAHTQIKALLELLPKAPEHCEEMLRELEKLRTLIDPNDEQNQALYRGGEAEGEAAGACS